MHIKRTEIAEAETSEDNKVIILFYRKYKFTLL